MIPATLTEFRMLSSAFSISSAVFAGLAAVLWWWSATIRTPTTFRIGVDRPDASFFQPDGPPLGIGPVATAHSEELEELGNALRKQSRISASAALSAGLSAACQVAVAFT